MPNKGIDTEGYTWKGQILFWAAGVHLHWLWDKVLHFSQKQFVITSVSSLPTTLTHYHCRLILLQLLMYMKMVMLVYCCVITVSAVLFDPGNSKESLKTLIYQSACINPVCLWDMILHIAKLAVFQYNFHYCFMTSCAECRNISYLLLFSGVQMKFSNFGEPPLVLIAH